MHNPLCLGGDSAPTYIVLSSYKQQQHKKANLNQEAMFQQNILLSKILQTII